MPVRTNAMGGSGLDPDELTATPDKVLSGYTAGVKGSDEPVGGTMPRRVRGQQATSCVIWEGNVYYRFPYGYYGPDFSATENEIRAPQAAVVNAIGLTADKLLAGQNVAGVNGVATSDANAESGHILSGASAYVNGKKIPGSIPYQNAETDGDRAWATEVVSFNGQINLGVRNGHFLNGVNWVRADIPNLQPQYIKKGVNIAGITGTFEGYSAKETFLVNNGVNVDMDLTTGTGDTGGGVWFNQNVRIFSNKEYDLSQYDSLVFVVTLDPAYSYIDNVIIGVNDYNSPSDTLGSFRPIKTYERIYGPNTSYLSFDLNKYRGYGKISVSGKPGLRIKYLSLKKS